MKKDDYFRSQFRLPYDLYEKIKASADDSRRSLNAELVKRLQESFEPENNAVSNGLVSIPSLDTSSPAITLPAQLLGASFFGGNFFYLVMEGDSMSPTLNSGDIVILDSRLSPSSGKIVVLSDQDNKLFVRRFVKNDNNIILKSDSPNYPPMPPINDTC